MISLGERICKEDVMISLLYFSKNFGLSFGRYRNIRKLQAVG